MSKVKQGIKNSLMLKGIAEDMEKKEVRFTIIVRPDIAKRLEICAQELNRTRGGFAADLVSDAISDAEEVLGLRLYDNDKLTEYGKKVYAAAAEEETK